MVKPIDQFGGWLRAYYVFSWIGASIAVVLGGLLILALASVEQLDEKVSIAVTLVDLTIYLTLISKIIKSVKIKDQGTPERIVKLMAWITGFAVLFTLLDGYIQYHFYGPAGLQGEAVNNIVKPLIQTVMWFTVWTSFFQKSKRVLAYYGVNFTGFKKHAAQGPTEPPIDTDAPREI